MWFRKPEFEILIIVKQLFSEVMIREINVNIKQNIVIVFHSYMDSEPIQTYSITCLFKYSFFH